MNFLVKNFLRGLAIVVPIAATAYVVWWCFTSIDRLLQLRIPGVGFLITIVAIVLIGMLASNIVVRSLFDLTDRLFARAPFVKVVYSSIKDLVEAFVGDRRKFHQAVIVDFPQAGVQAFGFITQESVSFAETPGRVLVYFPQSYNIAGNLFLVPSECVRPIDVDRSRLMAFVMSGGVSDPGTNGGRVEG